MIRLELKREPYWFDLVPGVRLLLRPCTTAVMMAARASMMLVDGEIDDQQARGAAMLKALGRVAIVDWDGVGNEDGVSLPPTPERINALLEIYPVFRAFEDGYFLPALRMDEEKNASAPEPNGTSVQGPSTVEAA